MKHLQIKYSISKAKDTEGYNVVTLIDEKGNKFKTCGGGYDMLGTVFGDWLIANYKERLIAKVDTYSTWTNESKTTTNGSYGWFWSEKSKDFYIDGACGIDSMLKLAKQIGLSVRRLYAGRHNDTIGYVVTEEE